MISRPSLILSLFLFACSPEQPAVVAPPVDLALLSDASVVAKGGTLFAEHCATCHGHLDEGRSLRAGSFFPPPPDFFGSVYRNTDPGYLFWRIAEGKRVEPYRSQGSVMPAWRAYFDDFEIWALVAYVRSRSL